MSSAEGVPFSNSGPCARYGEADKAMRETPGFRLQVARDVVAAMLEVLVRNAYELQAHLHVDYSNVSLKMDAEFVQETVRLLVNYCAAMAALVDTTRASIAQLCDEVGGAPAVWRNDEYDCRIVEYFAKHEYVFLKNLRNYMSHYKVPPIRAKLCIPASNTFEDLQHVVVLMPEPLLKWPKWAVGARKYIEAHQESGIVISDLVSAYQADATAFHDWLQDSVLTPFADEIALTQRDWKEVERLKALCYQTKKLSP